MPKVTAPTLPASLTVSYWDKAKGILARITKVKTGVTEELKAAKAALDKAPFGELNIFPQLDGKNIDAAGLRKIQDDYLRKYHPQFKALESVFWDLGQFLNKKAKEFEADDKTKKFAPALMVMGSDANKFSYAVAWGTVSSENQQYLQTAINDRTKAEKLWAEAGALTLAVPPSAPRPRPAFVSV